MGDKQTQTTRADPWKPAQAGLKQGIGDAQDMYKSGGFQIDPYQGQMVANYDPFRAQADSMTPGIAGANINNANTAAATAAGMMDPNQHSAAFGQTVRNTIADIMPGINGSFAKSGMTGSTLHQQNLASGLGQGVANVYDQSWNRGQDRALSAAGMMPTLNNAATSAADWLRNSGIDRQQYNQSTINADILRDQQAQAAPMQALQDYMALMSGVGGQFGTSESTQRTNPGLLSILGAGVQMIPFLQKPPGA